MYVCKMRVAAPIDLYCNVICVSAHTINRCVWVFGETEGERDRELTRITLAIILYTLFDSVLSSSNIYSLYITSFWVYFYTTSSWWLIGPSKRTGPILNIDSMRLQKTDKPLPPSCSSLSILWWNTLSETRSNGFTRVINRRPLFFF